MEHKTNATFIKLYYGNLVKTHVEIQPCDCHSSGCVIYGETRLGIRRRRKVSTGPRARRSTACRCIPWTLISSIVCHVCAICQPLTVNPRFYCLFATDFIFREMSHILRLLRSPAFMAVSSHIKFHIFTTRCKMHIQNICRVFYKKVYSRDFCNDRATLSPRKE